MSIVLIGLVYSYKGGISHYTGLMHRALKDKHNVTMISTKCSILNCYLRKSKEITAMVVLK